MLRALATTALLFLGSGHLNAETRLDLYRGRILCTIEQVCTLDLGCAPNKQFVRSFVLDFRDSGEVLVELGFADPAKAIVLSDRPGSGGLHWWNLAWMSGGPNILQIGFDHYFTMIEGPIELVGFDGAPPVVRRGKCEL